MHSGQPLPKKDSSVLAFSRKGYGQPKSAPSCGYPSRLHSPVPNNAHSHFSRSDDVVRREETAAGTEAIPMGREATNAKSSYPNGCR